MARYPTPTGPGYFWAKLIHPSQMPLNEDWKSADWEVVSVDINDPCGNPGDPEYLSVLVPGIGPVQWVEDFVWGPEVSRPAALASRQTKETVRDEIHETHLATFGGNANV